MKKRFLAWGVTLVMAFADDCGQALPKYGVLILKSPNKDYLLQLADTKDPSIYQLKILRFGQVLASYRFCGELVNAYWSPSTKFVAVNNSCGHGGIEVWVISLQNGAIITSHGSTKSEAYDFYDDDQYFTDLRDNSSERLKRIYPQADIDQLRNGYTSIAYGWIGEDQLRLFHEFGFDDLSTNYHQLIQAYTIWKVKDNRITLQTAQFRKVKEGQQEPMPPEVKKTLNFILRPR